MSSDESVRIALADQSYPIDELLAKYRPYLRLIAARQLDSIIANRLSASDIVQQTLLEAFRDGALFRGNTEPQFVAWLKAILNNNIAQATQTHILTQKRSVKNERPFAAALGQTALHPAADESPSGAAMQGESAMILAQQMESLPDDQYEAIRLRYIEGYSLAAISSHMDRSEAAVAGLLKRGLEGLRKKFPNN